MYSIVWRVIAIPRVYLDNCCFNRPYDDQRQLRIELETKAKLYIQQLIVSGTLELAISYISEMENSDNPFSVRRATIQGFFAYAAINVAETGEIIKMANEFKHAGLKTKDALHLASAIETRSDYFLTTDDRVLKHCDKRISILNPVDFMFRWEAIQDE